MAASIILDVGGPDFVGRILTDIAIQVNMRNANDTGVLGWTWTLLDSPIGSAASITAPFAANTDMTGDIRGGGYLLQLVTYADVAKTIVDGVARAIILIPFTGVNDWRIPAAGETIEDDANRGWAETVEDMLRDIWAQIGGGGGGGAGGLTNIPSGISQQIPAGSQSVVDYGELFVEGELDLLGSLSFTQKPKLQTILPTAHAGVVSVPGHAIVPVNPLSPVTLRMARRGTPGDLVTVFSLSDAFGPPAITLDGFGPLIDGQPTAQLTTPRERIRLRRQAGQQWAVVI